MLTIEFMSPVIPPGGTVEVRVNTDETLDIEHINIHAEACGALRGISYLGWDAQRIGPMTFTGKIDLQKEQPEGIMEVTSLNLIVGRQGILRLPRRDFPPSYFKVAHNSEQYVSQEQLKNEADTLIQAREKEFLSGWGEQTSSSTNYDIFVFYRNCYARGGDLVLRRARIFSFGGPGAEGILNVVEEFFTKKFGFPKQMFSHRDEISERFRQNSPCIAVLFPRVAADNTRSALDTILPSSFNLSLLMSLDSGAAPEFLMAGVFNPTGIGEWFFQPPVYRGNLISPFGPNDYFLNKNFELLERNPDIQFYFALYRDAVGEQNPDLAYFRYWTLLESVALRKGLKQGEQGVKKLLFDHEKKLNMSFGITVNNKHYTAAECIDVWSARRNITAHFGAFAPESKRQQQYRKSFLVASAALHEVLQAKHDFYLSQLREAAKLTLLSSLSNSMSKSS